MGIIEDIIARTLRRMERDLSEIKNIRRIDFVDLFPTSESHRKMLDEEAMRKGKIIEETERGNVYLLNNSIYLICLLYKEKLIFETKHFFQSGY